jgi:hypothetical protein
MHDALSSDSGPATGDEKTSALSIVSNQRFSVFVVDLVESAFYSFVLN